jgi:DNA-binding MarR family transcriptional regulator
VAEQLISLLERLVVGSVAITARAIAAADAELTFMQWRVLLVVGENGGGMAVGEIASRIGAHPSPVSRIVSRLRRRGLVKSARGRADARVVCVTLTDAGRDLRGSVLKARGEYLAAVISAASLAPHEADGAARLARSFEPFV